ncbi:MAG: four helix bundle protein [Verrucomicrobia bacterium]|nr:four helix bundle protein [Verrucomicrobiota bacterium]
MEIQEKAFEFAVRVVKLCRHLDDNPGVMRTLGNQLLRSGTSIGANYWTVYFPLSCTNGA